MLFFNLPSLLIVFGGTLAATLFRYQPSEFFNAIALSWRVIFPPKEITSLPELIDLTEEILNVVRRQGALAAEKIEINNAFFKEAMQMFIDGYKPESLKKFLEEERHLFIEKTEMAANIFRSIGDAAPAFGMIGTLIGLVQMLANLSDPSTIGPAMAVALLTTLYGAMLANLFALPLAERIESWAEKETIRQALITEAIGHIATGEHPIRSRQLLSIYLNGKEKQQQEQNDG